MNYGIVMFPADYAIGVVELARAVNDPQQLLSELGLLASMLEIRGQLDEARDIARELVAMATLYPQDAVWTLTRICGAWAAGTDDEPRLRRSVSRVQRPAR